MSMDSLKETFFAECEDLLDSLSEGLSEIADDNWNNETINAVFRAVHSIKGAAGAFGMEDLVGFAHKYETVLDLIRSEKLGLDDKVLHLITRSADCLADLVDVARDGGTDLPDALAKLTESLVETAGESTAVEEVEEEFVFEAVAFEPVEIETDDSFSQFEIAFAPHASFFRNGHEVVHLFQELSQLGQLDVSCDTDNIPELKKFDPDDGYLEWTITLKSNVAVGQIRRLFSFVDGLCDLDIQQVGSPTNDEIQEEGTTTNSNKTDLAQDTVSLNTTIQRVPDVEQKLETRKKTENPVQNSKEDTRVSTKPQTISPKQKKTTIPTLRVDPERVDRLINTVGELIINQAVISQKLQASGIGLNTDLSAELDDYRYLAREIQEGVMAIRAQPVKPLFQRMGRVVREAADSTSKSVLLITEGESTEIDKTLVERLADPLTHIIRNAIDHGIELPDTRVASGKDTQGIVKLSAAHKSGHVQIEITDDGAGINRERVFSIAVEKGLVPHDAKLTDAETDNLLFLPGFSTAGSVTNLSGRGVGMDVVKTVIQSMGGRVSISSTPGKGSTIGISLPLTLAVMDGMIVRVGDETLIIPLSSIVETIRPQKEDISPLGQSGHVLSVRGSFVPIVHLQAALRLGSDNQATLSNVYALIQLEGAGSVALGVDEILDQRQIVIKSLEGNYGAIPGISAATILGNGQIALIVDVDTVVKMADKKNPGLDSGASIKEIERGQYASLG